MAKQLYDYWFVQFDFPDENGKPYKSRGGAMIWNEKLKREIPKGWNVVELKDIVDANRGISYNSDSIAGGGVPMINLASFNIDGTYKHSGIKTFNGCYSKDKIFVHDILKFFNRLYSEHRLIPGNYIKLSTGPACSFDIWLSDVNTNNKLATEYIKDLVESITKKCGKFFCCRLTISCCLYSVKDKTLYTNYKSFTLDLDTNTLSPSLNKYAFLEQSDHHYKDLEELKYHNKDKLSKDVLDFIFK